MQDQLQKMTLDLNSMVRLHRSIKRASNPSGQKTCPNGGFCVSLQTSYSQVIPSVIPKEPNKWNVIVNESEVLVKRLGEICIFSTNVSQCQRVLDVTSAFSFNSHTDAAAHIEQIAEDAFKMANRTYSQLITLLEDNSTETYVQDLTEK